MVGGAEIVLGRLANVTGPDVVSVLAAVDPGTAEADAAADPLVPEEPDVLVHADAAKTTTTATTPANERWPTAR